MPISRFILATSAFKAVRLSVLLWVQAESWLQFKFNQLFHWLYLQAACSSFFFFGGFKSSSIELFGYHISGHKTDGALSWRSGNHTHTTAESYMTRGLMSANMESTNQTSMGLLHSLHYIKQRTHARLFWREALPWSPRSPQLSGEYQFEFEFAY